MHSRAGASAAVRSAYVGKLARELGRLDLLASRLSTVYFGGGSPALCDLSPVFDALRSRIDSSCEFTVELHPLDVTEENLRRLREGGVNRVSMGVQSLDDGILADMGRGYSFHDAERAFVARADGFVDRFDDAMCDDLNTSEAMGVLFEYVRDMNTALSDSKAPCKKAIEGGLKALNTMAHEVLGLLMKAADTTPEDVKALVEARTAAKKAKNFAEADRIRDEVLAMGYLIEDTPKGPKVKKA